MPNGIWNKDTYLMDVPEPDKKRASMTFDMLKSIDSRLDEVCKQPDKCEKVMDGKIALNNKLRRKFNLGLGSGGGISVVAAWELIRSIWS